MSAEQKQKYTLEGFQKLKDEYEFRSKEERERILNAIAEARSFGDLSENAEYDAARNDQAKNEARIQELEFLIQHAEGVDESLIDHSMVGLGSFVKVNMKGREVEYKIVGSNEADTFENKISDMSPVGRALIGTRKGDKISVETPKGMIEVEVLEVSKG